MERNDPPQEFDPSLWFGPPDRGGSVQEEERQRRAVSYHRYSKLTESPDSIDRQRKRTRSGAKSQDFLLVREYDEPKASGAFLDNRDVLLRLIEDVDELNVGVVLVESTDRLGRTYPVLGDLWGKLQDKRVTIWDASAGVPVDEVRFGFTATMAASDRRRIIDNLESGRTKAARAGKPIMGRCFGYRFVLDDLNRKVRAIDPEQAETVREVFRLFLRGVSPGGIVSILNADNRHGVRWERSRICGSRDRPTGILRRLRYTGVQTFRATTAPRGSDGRRPNPRWRPVRDWVLSPVVPELQIISPADFMAAQRKLAKSDDQYERRARAGRSRDPYWGKRGSYLLGGLVRCGQCGSRMYVRRYGEKGTSLKCGLTDRRLRRCRPSSVSLYWVETAVAELLGRELSTLEHTRTFVKEYNKAVQGRAAAETAARAKAEARLRQMDAEWEATFDSALMQGFAEERIVRKRTELRVEEETLRQRLAELDSRKAEPLAFRAGDAGLVRHALERLLHDGPVDTSMREGAELVAAMRALVEQVRISFRTKTELEVRIEARPGALVQPAPLGDKGLVLSGVFRQPPRYARWTKKRAAELERKAAEGRHRLAEEHWRAISPLLPKKFRFQGSDVRVKARTALEAAIFQLQNRSPKNDIPDSFGPRIYVARAVRSISVRGWWRVVEPALRELAPEMLAGVQGTKMFPVGQQRPAGAYVRMTPGARAKAGGHRLSEAEWRAVEGLFPSGALARAGLPQLTARQVLDAAMFLAKERTYPYLLPREFGPRVILEEGVWWLVSEGHWQRVLAALRSAFPEAVAGAAPQWLERHFSPARKFRLGGKSLDAAAVASKLREVRDCVATGVPTREAALRCGMPYQTYIRWRTNPVLRRFL